MSLDNDTGAAAPVNETIPPIDSATPVDGSAEQNGAEKTVSWEDTLSTVYDKISPKRDPLGRYAQRAENAAPEGEPEQGEGATKDETESADQPAEKAPGTEQTAPSTDAPHSWSAEAKAKWASLPPDLQQYITKRESEAHQAITRAGDQLKGLEPIGKVIEQFSEVFERNQLEPADGIARMLAIESWLGQDPKAAIGEIAKAYGVDLAGLTPQQGGDQGAAQDGTVQTQELSTVKQQLAETQADLRKVTSFLTAQQRQKIESDEAALARQIAEFANEQKDGKPLRPHFEQVREAMGRLMKADESLGLEQAYEQATWGNPEIRTRILADQRKTEDEKRQDEARKKAVDAKRSAQTNLKSTPGSGTTPKNWEDTLVENAKAIYAR